MIYMLSCKCYVKQSVLDFITFCSLENRVGADILCEIFNEWKYRNKRTDKYNIHI